MRKDNRKLSDDPGYSDESFEQLNSTGKQKQSLRKSSNPEEIKSCS